MARRLLPLALILLAARGGPAAEPGIVRPYEAADPDSVPATPLDAPVLAALRARGIEPAPPCSDAVFVRRVHLDLLGRIPTPEEAFEFLRDGTPGKRARLVDALLEREEHADYWAMRWCDCLRVKSEFPVNLWPNAVQAYHRWVRDAMRENLPYDRFARALLTSGGSNFRVPPVNFLRAVQGRDPESLAAAAALTFLGARVDGWPAERRRGLAAFFSRVAYKRTDEWKEEIVFTDPAPAGPVDAVFPDGAAVRIPPGEDPRVVFADWLVRPGNPWFARAAVNRTWSWIFGRGVVHEPDDLRPDNPPSVPRLLEHLERELVLADFDLRQVIRLVLNSRTYQQSPVPRSRDPAAGALFASYPVRRLDAEVLRDALDAIGGTGEGYQSAIPEPFTFVPGDRRTVQLADGSITSPFLEAFGRPPRDTGLESERNNRITAAQRLHLLNSSEVRRRIEQGPLLRRLAELAGGRRREFVRVLYLALLSRYPEADEAAAAEAYLDARDRSVREAAADLAWALVNSKEFLYRH